MELEVRAGNNKHLYSFPIIQNFAFYADLSCVTAKQKRLSHVSGGISVREEHEEKKVKRKEE